MAKLLTEADLVYSPVTTCAESDHVGHGHDVSYDDGLNGSNTDPKKDSARGHDYATDLKQLYEDNILFKCHTLYEKWGKQNKFWLIMMTGQSLAGIHSI
jgi:hypothetical protein